MTCFLTLSFGKANVDIRNGGARGTRPDGTPPEREKEKWNTPSGLMSGEDKDGGRPSIEAFSTSTGANDRIQFFLRVLTLYVSLNSLSALSS